MFSYEIYKIFKNAFFCRTSLSWCLLLAIKSVNQWKHTLKVYAAEKEMIYLNGTSKVSISGESIHLKFCKHFWHYSILVKLQGKARSSRPKLFKGVLENFSKFTGKHVCQSLNFIKKETLAQGFSYEFCKIFKNTFFHRTPPEAASEKLKAEAVACWCSVKKVFLEISLNSQENNCVESLFWACNLGLQLC